MNQRLKVLIVDDESSQRTGLAAMVSAWGMIPEMAADGNEALAKLNDFQADVIITDLNMPHLDGISLTREIRSKEGYNAIPILVLTTESQAAKKEEAKAAGATGWIVKPFVAEKLLAVVQKVIR